MSDLIAKQDRASKARWRLLTAILTTYGYGLLGTSAIQPVLTSGKFTWGAAAGAALGIACQAAALYISPKGEQ